MNPPPPPHTPPPHPRPLFKFCAAVAQIFVCTKTSNSKFKNSKIVLVSAGKHPSPSLPITSYSGISVGVATRGHCCCEAQRPLSKSAAKPQHKLSAMRHQAPSHTVHQCHHSACVGTHTGAFSEVYLDPGSGHLLCTCCTEWDSGLRAPMAALPLALLIIVFMAIATPKILQSTNGNLHIATRICGTC